VIGILFLGDVRCTSDGGKADWEAGEGFPIIENFITPPDLCSGEGDMY
jgi:hypothetical protein